MRLRELPRREATIVRTVDSRCALGESPLWLSEVSGLRWVDAERGDLHALTGGAHERWHVTGGMLADGRHERWHVTDGVLAAVAADERGGLVLVADRRVLARADGASGVVTTLAEIPEQPPGVRFNDAKVGPDGRLWAGTVCPGEPAGGALWSIDAAGTLIQHWTGIGHGNGIGWSPSADVLYFVDSGQNTLSRAPFADGVGVSVGDPEVIARLDHDDGILDGLAVDVTGELWVAVWGGGCLVHLSADGTPQSRVDLPAANVTSCAFAGDDLDLLAVTTAAGERGSADGGGSMYVLDIGRRGLAVGRLADSPVRLREGRP